MGQCHLGVVYCQSMALMYHLICTKLKIMNINLTPTRYVRKYLVGVQDCISQVQGLETVDLVCTFLYLSSVYINN